MFRVLKHPVGCPTESERRAAPRLRPSARLGFSGLIGLALAGGAALADEGGVSFWLPGQFASFAAIAPDPGFSLPMQTYYYTGNAGTNVALNRGDRLSLGVETVFFAQFLTPTWTPDTAFLGARPSFSLSFYPGWNRTSADVTIGAGDVSRADEATGFGDLYPMAQLFWNKGVHNWMAYVTGDIPVGAYDPDRLSNLGLGHAAIDVGGAYTYLDTTTGWEFSATAGLTYNFENTETDYTSGIDSHLDVGMSHFLNEQLFLGLVGYAYVQLTPDEGQPSALGHFESRTFAVGPQVGYNFNAGGVPIYTNLRGYYEFAVENRTEGGSVFLTVNIPISQLAHKDGRT